MDPGRNRLKPAEENSFMNIIENQEIEAQRKELSSTFKLYAQRVQQNYASIKNKVIRWEYSLGPTHDLLPYERLIPNIIKDGKRLAALSKAASESKNLFSYGFDENGKLILSISRLDKNIEKFGETARYFDNVDGKKILVNAHIYEGNPDESRVISICLIYRENDLKYYLSVTPPRDWYVRVDKIQDNRTIKAFTFATSWHKQLNYDLHYVSNANVSKITINDHLHWSLTP